MVGQAADRSGAIPQGPAAIGVSLVFLEQLEKLKEDDSVSNIGTAQLLQVRLLQDACLQARQTEVGGGRDKRDKVEWQNSKQVELYIDSSTLWLPSQRFPSNHQFALQPQRLLINTILVFRQNLSLGTKACSDQNWKPKQGQILTKIVLQR